MFSEPLRCKRLLFAWWRCVIGFCPCPFLLYGFEMFATHWQPKSSTKDKAAVAAAAAAARKYPLATNPRVPWAPEEDEAILRALDSGVRK